MKTVNARFSKITLLEALQKFPRKVPPVLLALLFSIFPLFRIFAQLPDGQSVQLLSPKEVFIGDTAEISYTFYSPIAFPMGEADSIPLVFEKTFESPSYTVKGGTLYRNGNQYRLSVMFTPWKAGTLDIPPFDLLTVLSPEASGFEIDLQPVMVASLVEKTGKKNVQPPLPPILIPGTIYVLYLCGIIAVILLFVIFKILFNLHSVISGFSDFAQFLNRVRNKKSALRSLRKALKASDKFSDSDFACELERIIRKYLVHRFGDEFSSLTTNKIVLHFYELTGDTLSLGQSLSVESLANLFTRLDYIRFAQNSIDSMRLPQNQYMAAFDTGERERTVKSFQEIISFFERPERKQNTQINKEVKQNA